MARTRKSVGASADDGATIQGFRDPGPFTMIYEWVRLSGVSPQALALFVHLRSYVSMDDPDNPASWPGKERLAVLMRFADADSLTPYLDELVAIGAVEIHKVGMPAKNKYLVAAAPPSGYDGPMNKRQWGARFESVVEFRNRAAKEKSTLSRWRRELYVNKTMPAKMAPWLLACYDGAPPTAERWESDRAAEVQRRLDVEAGAAQRKAERAGQVPTQRARPQVSPVTGSTREQREDAAVTGSTRLHATGWNPEHVPGSTRVEVDPGVLDPEEEENPGVENRGDRSSKSDDQEQPVDSGAARPQAQEDLLIAELQPIMAARPKGKPRWREEATLDVLVELRGQAPFGQIRLMMLHLANGTFGFTGHPNRALQQTGPWWEQAQTEYRKSPESWSSTSPKSCPNRCDHGWMVDPTTRQPVEPAVKCTHKAMAGVS